MNIILNGQERQLPELEAPAKLNELLRALELKSDRVAVERNGAIVTRAEWDSAVIDNGDKLEIVHFVGGGTQ